MHPTLVSLRNLPAKELGKPLGRNGPEDPICMDICGLVHEIRNPLTKINLSLELLKSEINTNDAVNHYFNVISRSTAEISDLVRDLLQSFKISDPLTTRQSINQILDETLEIAGDRIAFKNIRVSKLYMTGACYLMLDKRKIKIALLNIIINAIEAMSRYGELKISTKVQRNKCLVTIEDNGIGISKENIGNIFNPYFSNKPEGIGLGLASTRSILQSHNASVRVESRPRKGTRFIISFNLHNEQQGALS